MTDKPRSPFIGTTRTEGAFVAIGVVAFTILASSFLGEDKGSVAGIAAGALACFVIVSWPLRKERWFWALFGIFTGVNAFAVMRFDWSFTDDWSGHAFASLLLPDLAVMLAIVYGLFRLIYGRPTELVEELPGQPRYDQRDLDL